MREEKEPMVSKNQRIFELDFVRGILIFLMCLQPLCWFFYRYLYGQIWNPLNISNGFRVFAEWTNRFLYEQPSNLTAMSVAWCLYFTMAGISLTFSQKNHKRALITFCFFIAVYIVAALCQNFLKYPVILNFGIFSGYAFYMIAFQLVRKLPLWFHITVTGVLFVLTVCCFVFEFNFDLNPLRWFGLSQKWKLSYLDEWLLMPSLFFYALGGVLGRSIYKKEMGKLQPLNNLFVFKPLLWFGRNSMLIYVANIVLYPIIFIVLTVVINGGL
ncbi:MAG: DUF1624 domain-containing protein [Christensenellaceae bacterium]|jgi:uncharacterized membrane protein|nr:DUF1624 domain-containing protein [Christensenellaceae bacterium]